jgi:hypothetical protein
MLQTIPAEIPFTGGGVKVCTTCHVFASSESGGRKNAGGDSGHLFRDGHLEPFQDWVVLVI